MSEAPPDESEDVGAAETGKFWGLLHSEWLQAVADSAPVAVMAVDTEGLMTFWNRAAEEIFGWRAEEVLGRPNPIVPAEKDPEFRAALDQTISGSPLSGVELERRRKDGSPVWIRLSNAPITDAHGRPQGVLAVAEDISERVATRRRLDRLNRALRARAAFAAAMAGAAGEEQLYEAACRAAVDQAGYRLAWVGTAGGDPERLVVPVASAGFEEGYLEGLRITWDESETGSGPTGTAIRTGAPAATHDIAKDPRFAPWREDALRRGYRSSLALPLLVDGRAVGALNLYAPEPDAFDAEEIELLSGLAHDLSVAVSAARLREARRREIERTRQLLEATLDGYILADTAGRILEVNPAYCRMVGYTAEELAGKNMVELEAALDRTGIEELIPRMVAAGSVHFETRHRRKDGTLVDLDVSITILDDPQGPLVAAFVRDVTEERRLREELEARVAERTAELRRAVDLMAGREIRMAELKEVVQVLRRQLEDAGMEPAAGDPLLGGE